MLLALEPPPMPICIAGMHRSGSSMVARVLNLSGLYLGQESELFAGRPDNPEGFFEHIGLHEINDRVLEAFNASWDVPGSRRRPAHSRPTARIATTTTPRRTSASTCRSSKHG